jgi:hypothetical protein
MVPTLLQGDAWKELEWRHFSNSDEKFDKKEEFPPIFPPNMGRSDGPSSWTDAQRHWALKELQIKRRFKMKGSGRATRRQR